MPDPNQIFKALKNETRRKILEMLASEPMYLTQLSGSLGIGQQAIFRHLKMLEEVGLLESDFKDVGQGAPRRYYQIARQVRVEVQIAPQMFDVGLFDVPKIEITPPKEYPKLKDIVETCNNLESDPNSKEKLHKYSILLKKIGNELDQINKAKAIAEATYSNIRLNIRKITYALTPERIARRIIQTLASRGNTLNIDDLALILNLSKETIIENLEKLANSGIVRVSDDKVILL
ncbi:MAG: ArsR family transcriptional regulator [Asgard group archaeon]|nr:ArsR family transcriptional regulator [Asgard group archaeon]